MTLSLRVFLFAKSTLVSVMPSSVIRLKMYYVPEDYSYAGLCTPFQVSLEKLFLGGHFPAVHPGGVVFSAFFIQMNLFKVIF